MATWNPLKKNYISQTPTPAPPCLSSAEDRELEIAVQRLIHVENTIRRLIKEMKKYIETISNLDKADQRLTYNLSNCQLVHVNEDFRKTVENYHSVTTESSKTVQNTIMMLQKTFIEPLRKMRDEFVYISDALNKREELVQTWKSAYNTYKKIQEKKEKSWGITGSQTVKLEKERKIAETTAQELKVHHAQLIKELPVFLEKRLEYLKPTVQALITVQLDYYGDSTKMFTQLMPIYNTADSPTSATISEEEYNQTINGHLNRIRSLTIIKND